jgi:hypothetical protein
VSPIFGLQQQSRIPCQLEQPEMHLLACQCQNPGMTIIRGGGYRGTRGIGTGDQERGGPSTIFKTSWIAEEVTFKPLSL